MSKSAQCAARIRLRARFRRARQLSHLLAHLPQPFLRQMLDRGDHQLVAGPAMVRLGAPRQPGLLRNRRAGGAGAAELDQARDGGIREDATLCSRAVLLASERRCTSAGYMRA